MRCYDDFWGAIERPKYIVPLWYTCYCSNIWILVKKKKKVNKLHSLTEKLCRFESHSKFIQICISEGIKPWTHFLRHHFTWPNRNILRSATYSVLCTCRAFYTRAITTHGTLFVKLYIHRHCTVCMWLFLFLIFINLNALHICVHILNFAYTWYGWKSS